MHIPDAITSDSRSTECEAAHVLLSISENTSHLFPPGKVTFFCAGSAEELNEKPLTLRALGRHSWHNYLRQHRSSQKNRTECEAAPPSTNVPECILVIPRGRTNLFLCPDQLDYPVDRFFTRARTAEGALFHLWRCVKLHTVVGVLNSIRLLCPRVLQRYRALLVRDFLCGFTLCSPVWL